MNNILKSALIDAINLSMLLAALIVYSSFHQWGLTRLNADGMQLLFIVFIASPVLFASSLYSFLRSNARALFRRSVIPFIGSIAIVSPILDQHITIQRANIGIAICTLLIVLVVVLFVAEQRYNNSVQWTSRSARRH